MVISTRTNNTIPPTRMVVCALTSSDAVRLERLIVSVARNKDHTLDIQGLVVCNTLNEAYPPEARAVAEKHGWDFIRTESNGKPGKGKNSALHHFTERYGQEYDYVLMMDGDDFLYDCALSTLERIINLTDCDVLGLQTNDIIDKAVYQGYGGIPLDFGDERVYLYSWHSKQQNLYAMPEYFNNVNRTHKLGQHSTPDRLVLFSFEAATLLRCSEELPVYEDYTLSLSAEAEFLKGRLSYFNTSNTHIYVYDKTNQSSTCKVYNREFGGDWSAHEDVFKKEVETLNLETVLGDFHASEVPFICPVTKVSDPNYKIVQIAQLLSGFPASMK